MSFISHQLNSCFEPNGKQVENHPILFQHSNSFRRFTPNLLTIPEQDPSTVNQNKSSTIRCRKVDVSQLSNVNPPRSLKAHSLLNPSDKQTWDFAYTEEYYGLYENTVAWEYISKRNIKCYEKIQEHLFQHKLWQLKKYENGKPNRAKYRIVVLGNLDKHNQTKNDCFASVTSQLEFKLLIALSVHLKLEPK